MLQLQWSSINLMAVFAAWIVHIVMSLLWFNPRLFGNEWSRLTGKENKPAMRWIVPGILGHLFMVFMVAVFIIMVGANNAIGGMIIGLMAWAGFIVPMEIGELIWEKIPFKLFLIRIGNQFLGIAVAGLILGNWQ